MSNFYLFSWNDDRKELASAFYPDESKLDHELIADLEGKDAMPLQFALRKLRSTKNGLDESDDLSGLRDIWLDYLPNSLAWPIMSQKLRDLIIRYCNKVDYIDWIKCVVIGNNESRDYYVLRFKVKFDVLNSQKTLYVKGTNHVIKPHFSMEKIGEVNVFTVPESSETLWKITSGIYVSEMIKKAVKDENLTGMIFSKALAS